MSFSILKSSIFLLAAMGLTTAAPAENVQGNSKGFKTRQIGLTQNGAPLLQSFYFKFNSEDHHFGGMEVQPNAPTQNQMKYGYSDTNGDDEYFYNITLAPYFGEIFRRTHEPEFCHGASCTFPIEHPANLAGQVFVLRGFYIQFRGGDHHIDQIRISESNGMATVALNDQNDDDNFAVNLHYAYIPQSKLSVISSASGTAAGGARVSIPAGIGVVRGFNMDFVSSDRHIRDIGVIMNGSGRLEVYYGDKTPTDQFRWKVDYGILR